MRQKLDENGSFSIKQPNKEEKWMKEEMRLLLITHQGLFTVES